MDEVLIWIKTVNRFIYHNEEVTYALLDQTRIPRGKGCDCIILLETYVRISYDITTVLSQRFAAPQI